MKKIIIVAAILFSICGCTYLGNQISNVKECWRNSDCRADAFQKGKEIGFQTGDLTGLTGIPWAGNIGRVIGGIAATLVLLASLGAVLKKKKENE